MSLASHKRRIRSSLQVSLTVSDGTDYRPHEEHLSSGAVVSFYLESSFYSSSVFKENSITLTPSDIVKLNVFLRNTTRVMLPITRNRHRRKNLLGLADRLWEVNLKLIRLTYMETLARLLKHFIQGKAVR